MSDKKKVYAKLQRLPLELYSAYAVRKAIQLMPVLAMTLTQHQAQLKIKRQGFFQYWPEQERALHLLNLLRAVDVALYMADTQARSVVQSRSSLEQLKARSIQAVHAADDAFSKTSGTVTVCVLDGIFEVRTIMVMILAALDSGSEARGNLATCLTASKVLLKDVDTLSSKMAARYYLQTPLWPDKIPNDLLGLWRDFQTAMLSMNAGFEFWQRWYQQRLDGVLVDSSIWEQQVFLPKFINSQSPASINQYLLSIEQEDILFVPESEKEPQIINESQPVMEPVDQVQATPTLEQQAVHSEHEGLSLEEKISELASWVEEVMELFLDQVEGMEGIVAIDQLGVARESLAAGLHGTTCESMKNALDIFLLQLNRFTPIGNTFTQIENGQSIQALIVNRVEVVLRDLQFVLSQLQGSH